MRCRDWRGRLAESTRTCSGWPRRDRAGGSDRDPYQLDAAGQHGGRGDCVGRHSLDAVRDCCRDSSAGAGANLYGYLQFLHRGARVIASLFFGWLVLHLMQNDRILAVSFGDICLLIVAGLMLRVIDPQTLSIADA